MIQIIGRQRQNYHYHKNVESHTWNQQLARLVLLLIPAFVCTWISVSKTFSSPTFIAVMMMNYSPQWNDSSFTTPSSTGSISSNSSSSISNINTNTNNNHNNNNNNILLDTEDIINVLHEKKNDSNQIDCFRFNSQQWIDGPRLGNDNTNDNDNNNSNSNNTIFYNKNPFTEMTMMMMVPNNDLFVFSSSFNEVSLKSSIEHILQQTICYQNSTLTTIRISNDTNTNTNILIDYNDNDTIRIWMIRLIYISIYIHQHSPAYNEYRHRKETFTQCCSKIQEKQIGTFDYECPDTQFLVVHLFNNGIGANIRLAAVPALVAGIVTNRIVLFVSNSPTGPKFLKEPWTLSSCKRKDYQCFFLPITPCVVTTKELDNAYVLKKNETRFIFRMGTIPKEHINTRVLIMHQTFRPQKFPINIKETFYNLSNSFLTNTFRKQMTFVKNNNDSNLLYNTVRAAANAILLPDEGIKEESIPTFKYYGAGSIIFHGILLYALRPNIKSAHRINEIVTNMLPNNFNSERSLGIPIRASDKCGAESECMNFQNNLDAGIELWSSQKQQTKEGSSTYSDNALLPPVAIVTTTESQTIRNEYELFLQTKQQQEEQQHEKGHNQNVPSFVFYTNEFDVTQDTGYISQNTLANLTISADDVMISAISSLKAQLATSVTIGNCCSNFHLLLKDLLEEGCGLSRTNYFQCLQEHDNPKYRICCAWDKSPECQHRWKNRGGGGENVK